MRLYPVAHLNEQHKSLSIIEALKAAALEWTFEPINFVAGSRGAVVEDNFLYISITSSKGLMYTKERET